MKIEDNTARQVLGHKIRFFREKIGLSQVQLGKKLGYTSSGSISLIEGGKRGMDQEIITKTAEIFGVHPMVLMSSKEYSEEQLEMFLELSKIIDDPNSENYKTLLKLLPVFTS